MRNDFARWISVGIIASTLAGCQTQAEDGGDHEEGIAVTAWGERYEIFAEVDRLAVGELSRSQTHVTLLETFSPLREGTVSAILRSETGSDQVFIRDGTDRDGIFSVEITPIQEGFFDLLFRVEGESGSETIPAGHVQVGQANSPGHLVQAPHYGPPEVRSVLFPPGEEVGFLKEEQWRTPFATDWALEGEVLLRTRGPARITPAAGGEVVLSSPVDGLVALDTRAYVGMEVPSGSTVLRLTPRVPANRSFEEIRSELELATARLDRLEELLAVEAVSRAEVQEQRARVRTLTAESQALHGKGSTLEVRAPFGGQIAEVHVVAGEAVEAGSPLVRLVRSRPIWVQVSLRPDEAGRLDQGVAALVIRPPGGRSPITFRHGEFRLVSRSPEIDRSTGSILVLFEISTETSIRPGAVVDAEVLLRGTSTGILLPTSAIVDDGGVPVTYLQVDGESFLRVEIETLSSQGDSVVVEGVPSGARIVTQGGPAIRRTSLLRTGEPHGHVH